MQTKTYTGLLVAITLGILDPRPAQAADTVCNILGSALYYSAVGSKQIVAKNFGPRGYYIPSPLFGDSLCAPKIRFGKRARFGDHVVATATEGNAVKFRISNKPDFCAVYGGYGYPCIPYACGGQFPYGYPCLAHGFYGGSIMTGGGEVKPDPADVQYGWYYYPPTAIDTTGTHPQITTCTQAMGGLAGASAALAQGLLPGEPLSAARPIIDLGDVTIDRDDALTLDPTPGEDVTVYRVRNLTLEAGRLYAASYGPPYQAEGAYLQIYGDSSEMIVLNVTGALRLGGGSQVLDYYGGNIINMVGTGSSVVFKRQANVESIILAPERTVKLLAVGGGFEWPWGTAAAVYARDVRVTGSGFFGYYSTIDPVADCGFPED